MKSGSNQLIIKAVNRCLLVLIGFFVLVGFNAAIAQEAMSPGNYKAPLKYAIQLPPYCHAQYFGRTEPQYRMPEGCGPRLNHFCPGVIKLFQARDTMEKNTKMRHYKRAHKDFLYTKRGIEPFPQCPLHRVVDTVLLQVEAEMKMIR